MFTKSAKVYNYYHLFSNANHYHKSQVLRVCPEYFQMINKYTQCLYSQLMSTKVKFMANIEEEVQNQFEEGLKYRGHCGRRSVTTVSLPSKLELAANRVINSMSMPYH